MVEDVLHKFNILEVSRQAAYLFFVFNYLFILILFQTAVCNKTPDLIELSCIEPDPVSLADVDQHTRDGFEIFSHHEFAAPGTGEITAIPGQGTLLIVIGYGIILIDIPFGSQAVEFRNIEPEAEALGTDIQCAVMIGISHQNTAASGTHGCFIKHRGC